MKKLVVDKNKRLNYLTNQEIDIEIKRIKEY